MTTRVPWRELSLAVLVAALLAVVALGDLGGASPDTGAAGADPSASGTVAPGNVLPSGASAPVDTATFCASYAAMADAYGSALNAQTGALVDNLRAKAIAFISVGTPPGMGVMEDAGRQVFVEDMLSGFGQPTNRSDPELAGAQLTAFNGFLTRACPGY